MYLFNVYLNNISCFQTEKATTGLLNMRMFYIFESGYVLQLFITLFGFSELPEWFFVNNVDSTSKIQQNDRIFLLKKCEIRLMGKVLKR